MEIKDSHIREAEAFLIGGNRFDEDERVPFIKNLETCDLLAVPGSGKTTTLQAKLYCLAKQMPFADGSGILVLSHTNKAVEEIERKLKDHCPQLFQYPNFVGTVQSFVNDFLTKPHYSTCNRQKIEVIDTDYFNSRFKALALTTWVAITETKQLFRTPNIDWLYNFNIGYNGTERFIYNRDDFNPIVINKPRGRTKPCNYHDWDDQTKKLIEGDLIKLKRIIFSYGILAFEDCYFYGDRYIACHPQITTILQNRFKYIFIDETQDLEQYQLDVIESIFNTDGSTCVIQRIGDTNQSIYNSGKGVKETCDWHPRENRLYLTKSYRLTPEIANVVDYFTLDKRDVDDVGRPRFSVDGLRKLDNPIPLYLIIFDKDTVDKLIPQFKELITSYNLYNGEDGHNAKNGFKVIGWSGIWKDEDNKGKLRLENIFPQEYKTAKAQQSTKNCLCDYLIHDPNEITLSKYQDNILTALCAILSLADRKMAIVRRGQTIEKYYTDQLLLKKLYSESLVPGGILSEQDLLEFQSRLFSWSFAIATHQDIESVYNEFKAFVINSLSQWFGFNVSEPIQQFLGEKYEIRIFDAPVLPLEVNTPHIEICSVHSVKGQTHCATMYVETSYHNYETEKKQIVDCLQKKPHTLLSAKSVKRSIEAIKMMYVGFSRPTHLLCFAVLKENLNADQIKYFKDKKNGWVLCNLTK